MMQFLGEHLCYPHDILKDYRHISATTIFNRCTEDFARFLNNACLLSIFRPFFKAAFGFPTLVSSFGLVKTENRHLKHFLPRLDV